MLLPVVAKSGDLLYQRANNACYVFFIKPGTVLNIQRSLRNTRNDREIKNETKIGKKRIILKLDRIFGKIRITCRDEYLW
jgi:hypothetical protein